MLWLSIVVGIKILLNVLCLQKGVNVPPACDKPMIMINKTMVTITKPTTFRLRSEADEYLLFLLQE